MKHFSTPSLFAFLILLLPCAAHAQQDVDPMVLIGSLSAAVSDSETSFANLPSGQVIVIGPNGVEVVNPADASGIDPAVPRVATGTVPAMPEDNQSALAQELESSFTQIMAAYDEGRVSEDDVLAIVRFLTDTNLSYSSSFTDTVEERFGPLVSAATETVPPPPFDPDTPPVQEPGSGGGSFTDANGRVIQVTVEDSLPDCAASPSGGIYDCSR